MSKYDMTFYDKPFYIEVDKYVVAIRGTTTNDLIIFLDHNKHGKGMIMFAQDLCQLMNENCEKFYASTSKESLQVGNTAKMREALKEIQAIINVYNKGLVSTQKTTETIEEIINQALFEPPRNCDVGTAEEHK